MKKLSMIISAILVVVSAGVCQAADASSLNVAVVNVQQMLQQSPRVAQMSKDLENQFKQRQAKISDEQKALQDQVEKFKKESPTLSQKQRDAMQKKIATERADLVKQVVGYQQDLNKEQNAIMQKILSQLNTIVANIAKSKNYALVLDSQAVIYANNSADITSDVESSFNNQK
jgi:outer membrane protein